MPGVQAHKGTLFQCKEKRPHQFGDFQLKHVSAAAVQDRGDKIRREDVLFPTIIFVTDILDAAVRKVFENLGNNGPPCFALVDGDALGQFYSIELVDIVAIVMVSIQSGYKDNPSFELCSRKAVLGYGKLFCYLGKIVAHNIKEYRRVMFVQFGTTFAIELTMKL